MNEKYKGKTIVMHDVCTACKGVDIVYCDSWMSYHISKNEKAARMQVLMPCQINKENFRMTTERLMFMNCLSAARGEEQTAEVIDGPKSIIY